MRDDDAGDQDSIDWLILQMKRFGRASVVSLLYLASLLIFGTAFWKALIVAMVLTVLQLMSLGGRRIVQFGLLFWLIAGIYWIEVAPLQKWAQLATAKIEMALTSLGQ